MARRLYLGRLPNDARTEDVNKFFEGFGTITDTRVMTGFGFVEFENPKDAEDAVAQFNGKPFMGTNILVEFAKESRPRREPNFDRDYGARSRRPPGVRVIVSGISRDTSWQDLKDFGREVGNVSFADIDRDRPGQGILEYLSRDDADRAQKELDGRELRGRAVRVSIDDSRSGPDNYRRDERYSRDDRHKDYDRRDYDRGYDRRYRSRSPPRREYEDRRYRSPKRDDYERKPPAGYDDYYRRPSYDDRRGPDPYLDRRRDEYDRRRDDRRRDERDYDDRAPRAAAPPAPAANGDAGWR